MDNNSLNLPDNQELANKVLDSKHSIDAMKVEQGFLGRFWGASSSIPNNIAALTILLLILFGAMYSVFSPSDAALSKKDCWTTIIPIVTLAMGYIFGEKTKRGNS